MSITLKQRLLNFLSQGLKFGAVGALGFVVDFTVFNLLRTSVLDSSEVHAGPIYAKVISTVLAILVNWLGNRYWTFSKNRQDHTAREGLEFLAVSLVGMGIGIGCLWFSHYVLGYTSVLADNIAGNVVGLLLGAVFRFTLYRYWVFAPSRSGAPAGAGAVAAASAVSSAVPTRTGAIRLAATPER
ncbi:GtrA family protein [Cryobacterium ruanii]|uniref:GtrA family protein n=1 Tax=Cryobacterium ruanii TaxID=1259197 RepID=A0A4R9ATL3_9MICO|nr:GtrA family protein [Cryobacterium ruanii]TFD69386.1 GtrA family protein [Cryobacterium ruanii]